MHVFFLTGRPFVQSYSSYCCVGRFCNKGMLRRYTSPQTGKAHPTPPPPVTHRMLAGTLSYRQCSVVSSLVRTGLYDLQALSGVS